MNVAFYRKSLSHHGVVATLYHAAYRAANQVTRVAVWNALALDTDHVVTPYQLPAREGAAGGCWMQAR